MTTAQTYLVIATLKAGYPHHDVSEESIKLWTQLLADLDSDYAIEAAKRIVVTAKWFPTIAEFRAEVLRDSGDRCGTEAWGDVVSAIARYGRYREPEFIDPYVGGAVDRLGWQKLCDSENMISDRARFAELYERLQHQSQRSRQLGSVAREAPVLVARTAKQLKGHNEAG